MQSKTIILSSPNNTLANKPRAILTLLSNGSNIEGKLRLYNLKYLDSGVKLGIYHNKAVSTATLNKTRDAYDFNLGEKFNLTESIFCALIDTDNKNNLVMSGGTDNGFYFTDEVEEDDEIQDKINSQLSSNYDKKNQSLDEKEDATILDKESVHNDENMKVLSDCKSVNINENQANEKPVEISEKDFNSCNSCSCKNCVYKEYFYGHVANSVDDLKDEEISDLKTDISLSQQEIYTDNSEVEKMTASEDAKVKVDIKTTSEIKKDNAQEFINSITEQLDEMFNEYPLDETIMGIIPNSKVIKVTDIVDNSNYIVGVIYENNEIRFLLYGVPAKYNDTPPIEIGENYQWLPLDVEDAMSDGYFVVYQDAMTGKLVTINVE